MKNRPASISPLQLFLLLALSLIINNASAQKLISGTVTNASNNEVLIGATVLIEGTEKGTTTDIDGKYQLEVTDTDILECSYTGCQSKSISVGTQNEINFQLNESEFGLVEVTVSARRIKENLQDVPIAVSSFSAQSIKSKGVENIAELGDFAPNVELEFTAPISGSSSALVSFIRGIGQSDYSAASEAGVGLYIDGVYYARNIGGVIDLLDIERVELLKGPQGTLFGRNTIGGAINVVTQKPSDEFGVRGEMTFGGFNQFNIRTTIDMPISDKLFTSVAISDKNQDGYVIRTPYDGSQNGDLTRVGLGELAELTTGNDLGNVNNSTIRGKLAWYPNDDFSAIVTADYTRIRENGAPNTILEIFGHEDPSSLAALYNAAIAGQAPIPIEGIGPLTDPTRTPYDERFKPDDPFIQYGTAPSGTVVDAYGLTATLRYDLSRSILLKSITSYRDLSSLFGEDADFSPLIIDHHIFEMNQDQFTQELQFSGKFDKLEWVGGLFYFQEDGFLLNNVPLAGGLLQFSGGEFINTKSYAAYGQSSFDISNKLSVTAGARYTIDNKSFEGTEKELNNFYIKSGTSIEVFPDPNDTRRVYPVGVFEDTFTSFDFRLGANYKPTNKILIYASYATGFKSGGWTTRLTAPVTEVPRFDPEEASTIEVGFKSEFNDRLRLNIAGFYTDYTNLQIVVQRAVSPTVENAAEATIAGFEADLHFVASKNFSLAASLGLLEGEYTRVDEGAAITTESELVNAPNVSASLSADWITPVFNDASLTWHADYIYKGQTFNNAENTPSLVQDPYGILNASVTYKKTDSNWSVILGAKNITNELYILSGFFQPGVGYTFGTINRPRYAYMTVRFGF
ncbi:MAG: TonB-dependent receptor [Bacteroidota bacterium]